MGKWMYVNLAIVLASIICMFLHFNNLYDPDWLPYLLAALFWAILISSGYYVYVYRINRPPAPKPGVPVSQASPLTGRPTVSLKKNRPSVVIRKNKDQENDK